MAQRITITRYLSSFIASHMLARRELVIFRTHASLVNTKNEVHVSILMSKFRVAPIQPMSIRRLELTAAIVAVNVASMLKNELCYEVLQPVFYSDSE